MESGDGMSFAEFSYPLFQGYDFWKLYDMFGVQLQIGGSDQYGNICAGIESVKYMSKGTEKSTSDLFGITTPLLTTTSGEKFGKSAGNAVWLDREMLSSFDLYQVCCSCLLISDLLTPPSTFYAPPTTMWNAT